MSERRFSRRRALATGLSGVGVALAGCLAEEDDGNGSGNGGNGETTGTTDDDAPTVGILENRTGNLALEGTSKHQASLLAIEEINENGGVLGEEVEVFDPDPRSDNQRYTELTQEAIRDEEVDALWAAYSSAARETIRPLINQHDQLYFYTTQYEGGVCDKTTFPVGATARQQLGAVVPYLIEEYGERIYIIAADYNFGQLSGEWVNILAEEEGAEIVGEEYIPLESSSFSSTINNIQGEDPDFIMSMLVGGNHAAFYQERAANDLDIPIGSSTTMAQGYEHLRLDPPALTDMYVGVNYMQELQTDASQEFVDAFYEKFPDAEYINQEAQNNYFSVYMWKEAVERAGTFDQEAVIEELESGIEVDAPEGPIELDPATHHMTHHMRVAHADENHEITFDGEQYIEPTFLHDAGCDLTVESEQTQYEPSDVYE
ncbi:urea ABC transporter substrate-binding protein [Halobacteria archaeon AArc-m2/3/4]|uniref:Urea ABC transporter substrate-binding protein n=1 Tax=Natronoglomus mannanivorans TaxID=2979990 RepID=A0ABT2QEY4_9EURY|nr:urea ABC transporter substrate-binding protein [Halobacteria archaeon AArc-m2/3/4]